MLEHLIAADDVETAGLGRRGVFDELRAHRERGHFVGDRRVVQLEADPGISLRLE
jgi:hypothetical protein